MACGTISSGRQEPCKDFVGGIKAFYVSAYSDAQTFTEDASTKEVEALGAEQEYFQYDVRHASGFTTTINSSRETGTTFYETALAVTLKGITALGVQQIETLMKQRVQVIVTDNNGANFVLGAEFGAEAAGTFQTGTAMGELYGYNLTLTSQERRMPLVMQDDLSTVTNLTISSAQIDPNA